jgi:glutamate/tyrosine decarboxylase-like PLP-dependent enzyme
MAEPFQSTPQWSRRAIGLKVFMALAELGIDGYAKLIEHQAAMGERLRELLRAAGWILVNDTQLPVVCFTHPDIESGRVTIPDLIARIYQRRNVWISPVTLGKARQALRACITSYETEEGDLDALMAELKQGLRNED